MKDDNSLPDNVLFDIYSMVVSDLIRRENIKQLQRGIKLLLLKRRSNRFWATPIEGLDEICKRIGQMDFLSQDIYIIEGVFAMKRRQITADERWKVYIKR